MNMMNAAEHERAQAQGTNKLEQLVVQKGMENKEFQRALDFQKSERFPVQSVFDFKRSEPSLVQIVEAKKNFSEDALRSCLFIRAIG